MELPRVPPVVQTPGVVDVNVTGSPLFAVAVAVNGDCAKVFVLIDGNVIGLATLETVMLLLTGGAAKKSALPACSARTVHVPALRRTIVEPLGPCDVQ